MNRGLTRIKNVSLKNGREVRYLPNLMLDGHWRIIWHSLEAREKWSDLVKTLREFTRIIQVASVSTDIRDCALVSIDKTEFEKFTADLTDQGLTFLPWGDRREKLDKVSPAWFKLESDVEKMVIIVAADLELARRTKEALRNGEKKVAGRHLGYPECCLDFFERRKSVERTDPLWFTFEESELNFEDASEKRYCEVSAEVHSEIFSPFRYLGIYLIPYYPCSLECEETREILNKYSELAESLSRQAYSVFSHMHGWPLKWSCLKGLAYLSTPVFDLEATSLPVYPELLVHKHGREYPETGVDGVQFPWNVDLDAESVNDKIFKEELV